ncbi:MAG: hypothetical protein A2315_12720 [Ignavibacteria bacterium RIFOXYB2_FULL_35_12]|nr:MAG: hypothetical protein A2058_08815 [Ignavibacteria bacterium GWA2_36_19]OGU53626.1 MAG: hypothetical protein A2006_06195 [Ignavibacteria bacterium GWC2_35_8]OGU57414.1 MAG: hypothetical protein A2X60_16645 [Ignavibacteria bacterium GWF2_35_20]OGU79004.1 MAG: hypothetical protein A2254_01575 [Ignavibacteria bacterium RIFOXYA2_FULL_35_9]OGU88351.1 MAG: hypothetical protein A2492_08680 [Ignavibacteria bacterium RIFOXYC12_FULL_35_11]OGU91578.1 MAG: hypothetical protein A3K31_02690 [Ignavibac
MVKRFLDKEEFSAEYSSFIPMARYHLFLSELDTNKFNSLYFNIFSLNLQRSSAQTEKYF